jgi:excisionase family DNA binding protein
MKYNCGTSNAPAPAPAPQPRTDGMITKRELAERLRVTYRTIENWQRAGHLPFIKISSVVLFHWPDVVEHLNTHFKVQRRGAVSPR